MERKNTAYKVAIIVLIAGLIVTNVAQVIRYNDAEDIWEVTMNSLIWEITSKDVVMLEDVEHFVNELDREYIYIQTIEPVGFINYSLEITRFRTVMYNVTYNFITEAEANGSIEVWLRNHTYTAFMTFDVAVANNREPMKAGNIYEFYHIYGAYCFFNVIYYEKIETGRI